MRVLVIAHGFPPSSAGGVEIYAELHARTLATHFGDEVTVLSRDHDPTRPEYEIRTMRQSGVRVVRVNNTFRDVRSFEQSYRHSAIAAIAGRVIDEFKPDVAHVHHLTCLSTEIVGLLAERRIPCFFTLHDYWLICHRGQLLDVNYRVCDGPEPSGCNSCLGPAAGAAAAAFAAAAMLRAAERRLPVAAAAQLRRAASGLAGLAPGDGGLAEHARLDHMRALTRDVTHFLAPSRCMRDRFLRFGVASDRISLSRFGFDHEMFGSVSRAPSDRLRLGFLGSLMVSKGPHVLLDAVRDLPRRKVSVDLYGAPADYHGDGGYSKRLEPLLDQDDVRVHGSIRRDEVPRALESIDVLVVPSIWPENSPLVIQEAFMAGVPVLASRIGGIPEFVEHGQSGLLFEPNDARDLSRTIRRILDEPRLLDTLRSGIPSVRPIEDDVRAVREMYCTITATARSTGPRPRLAAVVLNFRSPDDTLLAVRSLLASTRPIDDIIVIDNDDDRRIESNLKSVWTRIRYIATSRNLGFSGGMNVGIRDGLARAAARVLIVNSDVIVPPDAIEQMERALDGAPGAGIAGPVLLSRSEPDRLDSLGMSYIPSVGRMRHRGAGRRMASPHQHGGGTVDGVSGCLMLVERQVFDAVGLFEEDYFFGFEDLDLCLRARRHGFTTVVAGKAVAYHEGSRSIGATSPARLYFAARNHLLLARRAAPATGSIGRFFRSVSIVGLNLAHAIVAPGATLPARVHAVARGTRDYLAGRFGPDSQAS